MRKQTNPIPAGGAVIVVASSRRRGHPIVFDGAEWRYKDDNTSTRTVERPCANCGEHNTPEGHDPCIARLPEIKNACCGHGHIGDAYVQYPSGHILRGAKAVREMNRLKAQRCEQ